ncbi:MAG: PAS domain S-box protein [Deltaproteobacteria bacterium]|nr:PAS domain S-box protein [Deltaproteobacteria bacterium]
MASLLAPRIKLSQTYRALSERTRRRRALAAHSSESTLQRYRDFYERASDGVVVLDPELRMLYLNPMGEQITGYAVDGVAGRPFVDLIPSPQREPFAKLLADIEHWQRGRVFDLPLRTTSGDPIIVSVSTNASAGGEELRVLSFRDITEARALSEELRHTKEFLERLIDSTVDAIVAADMEGQLILFNQGAERIFGFREAEVLGSRTFRELFPEEAFEMLMEQLRASSDGGVGRLEVVRKEILNGEGEVIPVHLSSSIIYENGIEVGTVAVISDLREHLHIERRLVQAQERLVDAEKQALIAELAGTAAHELNQPLTSVMGYAELLQRRIAEDDSNHHAAGMIVQECERIAEIVRKIGKITRYETKEYVGRTQILDLDKASEDV